MDEINIPSDSFCVRRVSFDYAINISFSSADWYRELKIESEFRLTTPDIGVLTIVPERPGRSALAVISLLNRDVKRLGHNRSDLWMDLDGGYRIFVPDDPNYDAWMLSP